MTQAPPKTAAAPPDAQAAAAPAPPTRVENESRLVSRPDEIISVLGNGMTVIAKRYPAVPVAAVRMYVKAGSIWEQEYAGAGISHLFEHLLHGGATPTRSEEQSREILDAIGASTNAYTTFDHTCYYIDLPAAHAEQAVDLLADWVTRPLFPEASVQREVGVVQRELERGLQDPDRELWYKAAANRYLVHPARWPVIGEQPAVARLTRADILKYYHRMYVPARVCFVVAGDVDPEQVVAWCKKHFADFAARADSPISLPAEPAVTAPRRTVYPMQVAQVRFMIGYPTVDLLSEDLYPLDVMMYVLAAGESSRLRVELRDRQKLALAIDAASITPSYAEGTFYIQGLCLPDRWPALRAAIIEEFARLKDQPVDAATLAQAKQQALVSHIRSQQTASAIAANLAISQLSVGDAHFDDQYVKRLGQVTAAQIQAAARKYFDAGRLLTALVVPADKAADFAQAPGAADAAAGRIEVSDIRRLTLDNGLTVLLRRNTAVPLASLQMHFRGGLLGESADQAGVSRLMSMVALRGTKTRSAQQVLGAFESAGGAISSQSGRNSFNFSASLLADQLDAALPVFSDVVLHPSFPADELEKYKAFTQAAIERVGDDLGASASAIFLRQYFGDSPYGRMVLGTRESVDKLTAKELAAFHGRFAVATNGVLAIFGDIDLDKTEALVRKLFAAMPRGDGPAVPEIAPIAPPAADRMAVEKFKQDQAAQVDVGYPGVKFTDPDYYALTLLDTMISGYGLPGGWLHEELRGRQLVYVVHAVNLAWSQAGCFWIYAQCQPGKVNEVVAAIHGQIARVLRGDLTEKMLTDAKAQVLAGELLGNQTNDALAYQCALDELLGRGYDHYRRLAERINAVTLAQVNAAARKYLTHAVTTVTTGQPDLVKTAP
ncbi:MAG: hypothetical protein BIFFINMI_01694 [Phycisphaerae bacterium]|nr:hypothetical protein [Phycisphaerae bacterium]